MQKIKNLINKITAYFPTRLPVGVAEHNAWADSIIELTGPIADKDSLKWTIANSIMHLPQTTSRKSKMHFVNYIRKMAANQIAAFIVQDIKEKQLEAQKAAEAAKQLEQQQQAAAAESAPPTAAVSSETQNEQQGISKT